MIYSVKKASYCLLFCLQQKILELQIKFRYENPQGQSSGQACVDLEEGEHFGILDAKLVGIPGDNNKEIQMKKIAIQV